MAIDINALKSLKNLFGDFQKSLNDVGSSVKGLDNEIRSNQATLAGLFGTSRDAVFALRKELAVSSAEITRLGGKDNEAFEIQKGFTEALNTNVVLQGELMTDLFLIGKAIGKTSEQMGEVVGKFQDVGITAGLIRDNIEDAAKLARRVGVNTSAVFDLVTRNLDKMTMFSFKDGVQGLTRMAVSSAAMRRDMSEIFYFAEKVFDPDKAIEVVSGFQRLGLAVGALADPLRLTFLASEDVEELNNQLLNAVKNFGTLDKKTGQLKFTATEKRDLKEFASLTNQSTDELFKFISAQQKRNILSKDSKFSMYSEEDKDLITNLAQFDRKKDAFVVTLKGETKLTTELNEADLAELRQRNERNERKTLEDFAQDQLDETQLLNSTVKAIAKALGASVVGTRGFGDFIEAIRGASTATSKITQESLTQKVRGSIGGVEKSGELSVDLFNNILKGTANIPELTQKLSESTQTFNAVFNDFSKIFSKENISKKLNEQVDDENRAKKLALDIFSNLSGLMGGNTMLPLNNTKPLDGTKNTTENLNVNHSPIKVEGNVEVKDTTAFSETVRRMVNEQILPKVDSLATKFDEFTRRFGSGQYSNLNNNGR